jgi:hypothetical protein
MNAHDVVAVHQLRQGKQHRQDNQVDDELFFCIKRFEKTFP